MQRINRHPTHDKEVEPLVRGTGAGTTADTLEGELQEVLEGQEVQEGPEEVTQEDLVEVTQEDLVEDALADLVADQEAQEVAPLAAMAVPMTETVMSSTRMERHSERRTRRRRFGMEERRWARCSTLWPTGSTG